MIPNKEELTKDKAAQLMAEVFKQIKLQLNSPQKIHMDVSAYNPAVVNEVIKKLQDAGWNVEYISYGLNVYTLDIS